MDRGKCFLFLGFCLVLSLAEINGRSGLFPRDFYVDGHGDQIVDFTSGPSQLLSRLHLPTRRVIALHQLSLSFLRVTKDLASSTPRSFHPTSGGVRNVAQTLNTLQSLLPSDVTTLLSEQGIAVPPTAKISCDPWAEFRSIDGSCNNLAYPCWGKAEEPFQRWLAADYSNGIDEPRRSIDGSPLPSPRLVNQWVSGDMWQTSATAYPHYSNVMMIWGQMLSHEMILTPTATIKMWTPEGIKDKEPQCCDLSPAHPECYPIRIAYEDSYFPRGHCMQFVRSAAYTRSTSSCSPPSLGQRREQINQLTAFIDASIVYGSSEEETRAVREHGGRGANLRVDMKSGMDYPMRSNETCKTTEDSCDKRCFLVGEKRSGENPFLGALHTLWIREHNRLVHALRHRRWDEERLFQEVRKIIGAMQQHITYNEFLPLVLGNTLMSSMGLSVPTHRWQYNRNLNPTLYNVFVTAGFRFGHSMVNRRQKRQGKRIMGSPLLNQDFFSMNDFCNTSSDPIVKLLVGQAEQNVQKVDYIFTKELTNHLFAKQPGGPGLDLFSINIQRGRDHGIPSYNKWREVCGLGRANDYSDLRNEIPDYIIDRLRAAYGPGRVDDIDLYVAGISERPVNEGILGPTFTCIVANQFRNLKYGDRFWYENINQAGSFTEGQINEIRKTTFSGLLCRNANANSIQPLAFAIDGEYNPKISCEVIKQQTFLDLDLWY